MEPEDVVRIPVAPAPVMFGYAAYATLPATDFDLPLIGAAWLTDHCGDPLRATLEQYIGAGNVSTSVMTRRDAPDAPIEMLRAMRMGAEEERRYRKATHAVLVRAPFAFRSPLLHVLGPLAVANGIATTFDGVVLDPLVPRLLPMATQTEWLQADGQILVVKHIVCPMSAEPDGTAWMTTAGMPKFGLPNFEMRYLPPNLTEVLPIMNSVASRVLHEALAQSRRHASREPLREVTLPSEVRITQADLVAAFGRGADRGGSATVRLTWTGRARPEVEPFVEIGPPRAFGGFRGGDGPNRADREERRGPSEWYAAMLRQFTGG